MLDGGHHGAVSGEVAAQLVGDRAVGKPALFLQDLSKETDSGVPTPPGPCEDVEHVAVLIAGAPQVLPTPMNRDEELIEVPDVAEVPAARAEASRIGPAEGVAPQADRLAGNRDPALGQQILDIAEAEAEREVEPHGVGDDLRWKSVSSIAR